MKKRIGILGVSGSIGSTALNVVRNYPQDFQVTLIANNNDLLKLKQLINEFHPQKAICCNQNYFYDNGKEYNCNKDILESDIYEDCDLVINGISGIAGLAPTISIISSNKTLATANKESFVTAGSIINKLKTKNKSQIIPLDSEHSTVWQCIGDNIDNVKSIILTASGGAFRDYSKDKLKKAKAVDALKHPNWVMGNKITIDCATLMNKGMEIIEAIHLFGVSNIQVVQHNESIIHSMVEFKDNFVAAGLSYPDMSLPIQYALFYPQRKSCGLQSLDFTKLRKLHFDVIDEERFPCFGIAKAVSKMGDIAGTVMNSANEVAVNAYLKDKIAFYDIPRYINDALEKFATYGDYDEFNQVICMDKQVTEYTLKRIYGGK